MLLRINRNLIFYNQLEIFHLSKFRSLYAFHWIAIKDDKTLRKILLPRRNLITFAFWFQAHAVHSIYFRQRVISQKKTSNICNLIEIKRSFLIMIFSQTKTTWSMKLVATSWYPDPINYLSLFACAEILVKTAWPLKLQSY